MSAFPTSPFLTPNSPKRKPAAKVAKAAGAPVVEIRSRDDIASSFVSGSSYDDVHQGWAPIPRVLACDGFSLSSGAAWWALAVYLLEQISRNRKKGDGLDAEIEINKADASLLCRTSIHNVNLVLSQMTERKLAIVSHLAGGRCVVRFVFLPTTIGKEKFPGWSQVAKVSHEQWAREKAESLRDEADEQDEVADELEEQRVKAGIVQVVKKPRALKPGRREKGVPVNCGVKSHRVDLIEADGSLDVTYTAAVHSGEFVTTICVPKPKAEKTVESTNAAKRTESTTSGTRSGHIYPDNVKLPPNEGNGNHPHTGVDFTVKNLKSAGAIAAHPRAAELSALFDPAIYQSCKKTLSGDPVALKKACDAVEDTPHDAIVEFMVDRSQREIKPQFVASILLECRHNWLKSGTLPKVSSKGISGGLLSPKMEQTLAAYRALNAAKRKGKS